MNSICEISLLDIINLITIDSESRYIDISYRLEYVVYNLIIHNNNNNNTGRFSRRYF